MRFSIYNETSHRITNEVPVKLLQTDAFSDLLDETAKHGDVGFFSASGDLFARLPGLRVDEEVVLAAVVTARVAIAWADQLQDWLIPFNESDSRGGPVRTMLSLGNGPLAVDFAQFEGMLGRVKEHLLVAYVLPGCVGIARYRWNGRLLDTLNQLYQATEFYESLAAEMSRADFSSAVSNQPWSTRVIHGRIHADGAAEIWR